MGAGDLWHRHRPHEPAHMVREDYVDPTQIMYPMRVPQQTGYAFGDLTDLAQPGQGPWAPTSNTMIPGRAKRPGN